MKFREAFRIKTLPRLFLRLALGALAVALFAFVALVLWLRHVALPDIESYRADIVASIESASGMAVSVEHLRGGWRGFRPRVSMEGFALAERSGKPVLVFRRAEVTLSWYALLLGELRFHNVEFDGPELVLRRGTDGVIYLADKPLDQGGEGDGRFSRWLLAQPRLAIHDATLVWLDEAAKSGEIRLTGVEIAVRREGTRHKAALTARAPRHLASQVDLRADVQFTSEEGKLRAAGSAYAQATQADLARLRDYLPIHDALRRGIGSVRVWADFTPGKLNQIVADLRVRDVQVRMGADLQPLDLATLAGRVSFRDQPGGYFIGTEDLRLRTADGVETRPGSFSISLRDDGKGPRGELKAEAVDLKVAAALVGYFPLPREARESIAQFAPRGRLSEAALTWTGEDPAKAGALTVRARFDGLAVNAVGRMPGFSGLTGRMEGTEKGGELDLDAKQVVLDIGHIFRAPLLFDTLSARATWNRTGPALEVALARANFANGDLEGKVSGTWRALPDSPVDSPGDAQLIGSFPRFDLAAVSDYLPNGIAETREYLDRAIIAGRAGNAGFEVSGDLWHFPFAEGKEGRFRLQADLHEGRLRYDPDWPGVNAIEGSIRFDNSRMEIRATNGAIFASRLHGTTLVINDLLAKPPILELAGDIDTAGTDSARFLRESPLASGPGAFTRVVSVAGPARLALKLVYPLYGTEPARVNGDYTFNGASATVGKTLAINGVKGRLNFTEKGVRAPELTGTLFGHPAVVRIATETDGTVTTAIEGRISTPVLEAYVPEAIGQRLEGGFDWRAKFVAGREASQLSIDSDLKGLASSLPEPFAKAALDSRPLSLNLQNFGAANQLTLATLAGGGIDGGISGRFGDAGAAGQERWQAALRFGGRQVDAPARDGIWLYGELDRLDVDAWQAVFASGSDDAPAEGQGTVGLKGFDLKLGQALFTHREFRQLQARLTRDGMVWRGNIESPAIAGDVSWSAEGRGRVAARLSHFVLQPAQAPAGAERAPAEGEDLPALDIVADRFEFKGVALGRLELQAEASGEQWRIGRLDITSEHSKFRSAGSWRKTATGSITTLDVNLEADNLNGFMAQFGYGDYVKRGKARLQGQLAWPGFPYEFELERLQGNLKLGAERGQFAKIEPGAGKLLGLLSLQSLPRRASFDFRDVFSEGFAFESITATIGLARGVVVTNDLEISGPAAFVSMAGQVSLPGETQSLTLRVVPEVGETVALAATAFGTPVLGLSTLLLSKLLQNPLGKAFAYEYLVTGTWDNPSVTPISVPAPKAAAVPAAPAKSLTP